MEATDAPLRILGIGGSSRATSITRNVLADVLQIAYGLGAQIDLASVHELDLPVYNEDISFEDQPQTLRDLLEKMKRANGFVIASPTYHSSIGGGIKNVLDALHILHGAPGTYFDIRPVGLIAYGGPSAINSINALLHTTRGMRGLVVPTSLTVSRTQMDETHTIITDQTTRDRATSLITEVLTLAKLRSFNE